MSATVDWRHCRARVRFAGFRVGPALSDCSAVIPGRSAPRSALVSQDRTHY
jgi:hypothetical protein